jgi:sugar lactone lactonase YvrE
MSRRPPADVPTLTAELFVDARARLGEGPVWDEREGCLWWVDITGEAIHRTDYASRRDEIIPVGRMVGAVVLRADGGLIAALQDGFATIDSGDGRVELVAPVEQDDTGTRMNDGKVDPAGRFWAGTMAIDERPGAGTLYRLGPDVRATPMVSEITISNGLDWSLDGQTMYYIDTPTRRVDRFAFDPATGDIADRTTAFAIREGAGGPDGMTVDAEGFVWVALWDGWAVERYTPDGTLDRRIDVPVAQASSCTFGGPDLDVLFITTAQKELSAESLAEQPHAGSLFICRPGVRGRASFRFGA